MCCCGTATGLVAATQPLCGFHTEARHGHGTGRDGRCVESLEALPAPTHTHTHTRSLPRAEGSATRTQTTLLVWRVPSHPEPCYTDDIVFMVAASTGYFLSYRTSESARKSAKVHTSWSGSVLEHSPRFGPQARAPCFPAFFMALTAASLTLASLTGSQSLRQDDIIAPKISLLHG